MQILVICATHLSTGAPQTCVKFSCAEPRQCLFGRNKQVFFRLLQMTSVTFLFARETSAAARSICHSATWCTHHPQQLTLDSPTRRLTRWSGSGSENSRTTDSVSTSIVGRPTRQVLVERNWWSLQSPPNPRYDVLFLTVRCPTWWLAEKKIRFYATSVKTSRPIMSCHVLSCPVTSCHVLSYPPPVERTEWRFGLNTVSQMQSPSANAIYECTYIWHLRQDAPSRHIMSRPVMSCHIQSHPVTSPPPPSVERTE